MKTRPGILRAGLSASWQQALRRHRREDGKAGIIALIVVAVVFVGIIGVIALVVLGVPLLFASMTPATEEASATPPPAATGVNGGPGQGVGPGGLVPQSGASQLGTPPDPSTLGAGVDLGKGGTAIDLDGGPHAYAPAGSGLPTTDYLANAGHPGNWYGIETDNGRPDGNPIVTAEGYYVSTTSGRINGENYNADATPYIALSSQQRAASGAQLGDWVLITNNTTGQSVMAQYGDNRGSRSNNDFEISGAAASAVGVGFGKGGATTGTSNLSVTVYPGSKGKGG